MSNNMKNLKEYILNERLSHDQIWDAYEKMKEALGEANLLEEIAQALPTDKLEEYLKFIDRNNDLNIIR